RRSSSASKLLAITTGDAPFGIAQNALHSLSATNQSLLWVPHPVRGRSLLRNGWATTLASRTCFRVTFPARRRKCPSFADKAACARRDKNPRRRRDAPLRLPELCLPAPVFKACSPPARLPQQSAGARHSNCLRHAAAQERHRRAHP